MPETAQHCSFSTGSASWSHRLQHAGVRILTWESALFQGLPRRACAPPAINTDSAMTTQ